MTGTISFDDLTAVNSQLIGEVHALTAENARLRAALVMARDTIFDLADYAPFPLETHAEELLGIVRAAKTKDQVD